MPSGGMVTMARVAVAIELHEEPAGMVVQGTLKTITITLTDEVTGALTDPATLEMAVGLPSGVESLYSYPGELTKVSTGVYQATIDTTGAFGSYGYEVITDGDRRHRAFDAKPTSWPAPLPGVSVIDGGNAFSLLSAVEDGGNAFTTSYFVTIDGGGA